MRRTLFTLVAGAALAVFSYSPSAASWITTGREQGVIPDQVPAEATDPPIAPAAALTLIAWAVCWIVGRAMGFTGARPIEIAVAVKAVERTIHDHGREIISGRKRLKENREELKEAEAAETELKRELKVNAEDLDALANLISSSEMEMRKARDVLNRHERDVDQLLQAQRESKARKAEIDTRLGALSAAKQQLLIEQRELV